MTVSKSLLTIRFDLENGYVEIINHSDYRLQMCAVPENNKRKIETLVIINKKRRHIVDNVTEFDLNDYYFRFAK